MSKKLVIVESPAKAKTIEKILGSDYVVKSSYGHVRDLVKGSEAVDVEDNYKPTYDVSPEKKKVVSDLKSSVKKADETWLATDEDREGEAIAWHLAEVLGLNLDETPRIVFHEITKPAIQKAIQSPRRVDINLVNAQQARRVLDRLVGFDLSGLLWKKVKGQLSAGRVQSVAVELIVDRERDIQGFEVESFYKISANFIVKDKAGKPSILKATLPKNFKDKGGAEAYIKDAINAAFKISDIQVKPGKRKPAAPFTTSTLQQEASRKLGFSVSRTMRTAQKLYEGGHITYMRTDSTNLSNIAQAAIASLIEKQYGKDYVQVRNYKTKNASAQEAHEAIRPTYIEKQTVSSDRDLQRVYDLIWKRTTASQMAEAKLEKTVVEIDMNTRPDQPLRAEGEVLVFDGFLKVYMESSDDDDTEEKSGILPPLVVGQSLELDDMIGKERFTKPPARYTEASLVKKLEELGIGRPSTYAPTVEKIMAEKRGYVTKESRDGYDRIYQEVILKDGKIREQALTETTGKTKNALYATDMGIVVTDFLVTYFPDVMDYGFTADIENQIDAISAGDRAWQDMVDDFYKPFSVTLKDTIENADRASGERILGKDPETGRTVLVRLSRYGTPVLQIGTGDELAEDEKPRYADLGTDLSMNTVNLEEAMKMFQLPRDLGEYKGKDLVIGSGRYGPYVKYGDNKYVSIPRDLDALSMTRDQALELVHEKEKEDAPIATYEGHPITKGKGRFGPFVKWQSTYANVNKKYNFDALTSDEAIELVKAKLEKEANRYIHQWQEEKIAVENGRWGPFIRFVKKSIKIPKIDGERITPEQAAELTLDQVKSMIEAEIPNAFKKKATKAKAKPKAKAKTTKAKK